MNPEASTIVRLGREHHDPRGALDAIGRGLTEAQYRQELAQRLQRAKLLDIDCAAQSYSVVDALRDIIDDSPGLALEQSEEIFKASGVQRRDDRAVAVPLSMLGLGTRAAPTTAGTGAHAVPLTAMNAGILGPSLNVVRAGAVEMPGLGGRIRFGYIPDSGVDVPDSEFVFAPGTVMDPKPVRTACSFSGELLYSSMPSVDALLAQALRRRVANAVEQAVLLGDPDRDANSIRGIVETSGVLDLSLTFTALTHANVLSAVEHLDDQFGLGDAQVSMITSRKVVTRGQSTAKSLGITSPIFTADPTAKRKWRCDDLDVYATQLLGPLLDDGSPAELVDHLVVIGNFANLLIGYHGVLQLIPDVYGEQVEYGICRLHAYLDVSCSMTPESFAFARFSIE
jgi:hypothetical protein